jgi:predicted phage terminase large subunit-like protein
MVATYGDVLAKTLRTDIISMIRSPRHRQAFPAHHLVKTGEDELVTSEGGKVYILGRRSPTNGRGGHWLLVDDPIKDDKEASSPVARNDAWQWFTQTLLARRHTDKSPIVMTGTRWNDDDPFGRLLDPTNPAYSARMAKGWEVLNLPAIAEDDDPLGRAPGEALWPERFGLDYLEQMRAANPVAFSALYQGNPTPEEGAFFQKGDIKTYERDELPANLRIFAVSDHGVGTATHNDRTCLMLFGVCPAGTAYVLPDTVWRRMGSQEQVEEMLRLMRDKKPMFWWAERGQISRSIGPFLKKRMDEEQVYCPLLEEAPIGDKVARAQSARARSAQGRVLFPAYAEWWPRALKELLTFPNGKHDDFVDALSMLGLKLQSHVPGSVPSVKREPPAGSWAAMKKQWNSDDNESRARVARAGW